MATTPAARRLDRELERERHERQKQDDARSGMGRDDDERLKDARASGNAGQRHPGLHGVLRKVN